MKQVLLLCAVMALALASPMQGMDILYFYSTKIYVALFDDFFVRIYHICGQLNNGCGVIEYGYITHYFRTIPKCSFLNLNDFFITLLSTTSSWWMFFMM